MADTKIFGRIRQLLQGIDQASVGDDEQIALTEQLAQLIAFDSAQYGEIYKVGRAFESHTTSAAVGVSATTFPTTASLLQLYNGEPQTNNGRSYIIDRIWAMLISAGVTTVVEQFAIICAPGQTAVVAPASAGLAINQLNCNGGRDTRAVISTAVLDGATGVAANWRVPAGQNGGIKFANVNNTPGGYADAPVNGRIILPPGRAMGIHVQADSTTPTFIVGVEWHEKLIRLG